jgi:glycosyltransferase involved in cell wall biosynthesis
MTEIDTDNTQQPSPTQTTKKVLIFVVCYNAEKSIEAVLDLIPRDLLENRDFYTEVLIIDNHSSDRTFYAASGYASNRPQLKVTVLYNPKSQSYGANQKIGFRYAIEHGFDVVVLLHGDNRYAPERLPEMIGPILDTKADAVLGSRMIHRLAALKDGMPLYKWIGNQVLSFVQNRILGSRLSEFHSGYRAYSTSAIASIPFEHNSNDFDFDTDIIIQFLDTGKRITEVTVPTFYSSEIAGAHGLRYVMQVVRSSILSRVMRLGIYYHPRFDYEPATNYRYKEKFGYRSSHQFALDQVAAGATVLDIGCGPGFMAAKLAEKNAKTVSIDLQIQPQTRQNSFKCIEVDVEKYDFADDFGKVDYILVLDIIEHLKSPERLFGVIRRRFCRDAPTVIITTGNIAFVPMRTSLLFAGFHYGRRGILDMDHTRLFTFSSLHRTLELAGYEVVGKFGLPAPFPLAIGDGPLARLLLSVNRALIAVSKSLFSYQIAVIARPLPTLEHLLEDAHEAKRKKLEMSGFEKTQIK